MTVNYPLAYLRRWRVARIEARIRQLQADIASNLDAAAHRTGVVPCTMEHLAYTAKIWKLCEKDIAASISMQNRETT